MASLPIVLAAGNIAVGFGAFVAIGILTPIGAHFAVGLDVAAWVMTAYALSYAIGSPILAALTGRLSRRTALLAGLGVFAAGLVGCALAPNFPSLLAARIVAALGAGIYTPGAAAVAVATSPPERRARALSITFAGLTLAQVFAIPVGTWVGYTAGWTWTFAMGAGLAIGAAALVAVMVPSDLRTAPASLRLLAGIVRRPRLLFAIGFTATFLAGIYIAYTYFAPILESRLGVGRDGVTLYLLIFGVAAVVGNLVGGFLGDRIGPSRTLLLSATGILLLQTPFPLPIWTPLTMAVVVALWSVAGWSFMAPQQARLVVLAPEAAAIVLALNASCIYVGVALGSALGGFALVRGGFEGLAVATAVAALAAIAHLGLSDRLMEKSGTHH